MKYTNFEVLTNVSSSADAESESIDLSQIYRLSAQILVGSGTIAADIQVQVSNDILDTGYLNLREPINWVNLGSAVALAAPGVYLIPSTDMCYRSMRVILTNTDPGNTSLVTVSIMAQAL